MILEMNMKEFIYICHFWFKMFHISLHNRFWQWATLLFLSFIWGSSFILMKKGLEVYNNYQVAAFRIFFSCLLLLPLSVRHFNKVTRQTLKPLLIVGFIGTGIPALLFTTAQSRIDSALAGMLNSMTPFFTLLIGVLFYQSKVKIHNMLGIFVGLIGASGLVCRDIHDLLGSINLYAAIVILATVCYGININEVKAKLSGLNGIEITSLAMLFIGPVALTSLLFSDFSNAANHDGKWLSLFYIFLLATFCSVLALIIFNTLIKYTPAIFAASVTYIIPIFAILWGIFDGENVTLFQILWIMVILLGVFLVNKK